MHKVGYALEICMVLFGKIIVKLTPVNPLYVQCVLFTFFVEEIEKLTTGTIFVNFVLPFFYALQHQISRWFPMISSGKFLRRFPAIDENVKASKTSHTQSIVNPLSNQQ